CARNDYGNYDPLPHYW
nr:immunoglobulin heavy chain junction region [Macaca mulatta]MOX67742.1 immunoglobulin heavy chain junction region [Macaca mulatta]